MKRFWFILMTYVAAFLCVAEIHAQERGTETWETFTNANFVNALAVEGDYIWAGTEGGVVRWDTRDGTYIKYVDQLPVKGVEAVAVDGNGIKWFGTWGGGVSRFDGTTWKTYTTADGLKLDYVWAIAAGPDGAMWFGTRSGVSRFDGKTWRSYTTADGLAHNEVFAIAVGPDGAMWFGTHGYGVSRFDGKTWKTYTTRDGLAGNWVRAIAAGPDGAMWFGTNVGVVSRFDGTAWKTYTTADGLAMNRAIAVGPDGAIWFGTSRGVTRFDGKTGKIYTTRDGLAHNQVMAIAVGPDKAMWFGTWTGVSRFDGKTWKTYTTADGLADNWIKAIAVGPDGAMWFGTNDMVSRFDGKTWKTYTTADGLVDNRVNAIALGPYGAIWVGTDHGVSRFDGSRWKTYTTADGLADNRVNAIALGPDGTMWFGTSDRVSRFDGKTWKTYTTADGLADGWVEAIAVGPDGAMWFGTGGGVSRFDGNTWKTYTTHDGLASNFIEAIAVGPDGAIWVGTFADGVSRFDGNTWKTYTTADVLAHNQVMAIAAGPDGAMWFGTVNGLSKLTFSARAAVIAPSSMGSLILVAGGGAAKTNTLWETTNNLTNYMYKIFHKRGFEHTDIYYINPVSWQDFNGDGFDDHIVDAPKVGDKNPTIADLEYAITEWATKRGPSSEPLYIYMANHGGKESFRISPGEEINARTLDSFLDKYQSTTGNSVVLIIEACKSGSFVPILSDRNRVIITSAAYEEGGKDDRRNLAFYDLYGRLSFTQFFAGAIVQGHSLKKGFDMAAERLKGSNKPFNTQEPWMDDDGDGQANGPLDGFAADKIFVGGPFLIGDIAPEILEQSRDMSISAGASVTFFAKVSDVEGMKNVWATVTPPDFVTPTEVKDFETPIIQLPSFSLSDEDGNSIWEGSYSNFALNGEYIITIYARDRGDNITMSSPIKVIVTGGVDVQPVPPKEETPKPSPQPSQASIKAIVSSDVYRVGDTIEIDVKATGSGTYDQYLALVLPPGNIFICLKAANRVGSVNELVVFKKDYVPDGLTHRVLSLPILMPIPVGTYSFYAIMVPSGADLLTTPMEGWIYDRVDFRFE